MNSLVIHYRSLLLLLSPFILIFCVVYLTSSPIPYPSSTVSPTSDEVLSAPSSLKDEDSSSSTPMTKTETEKSTKKPCEPFNTPDTRPFFEREPKQMNLPRAVSELSRRGLRRRLRSLRLAVAGCASNVEKQVDRFRTHIEAITDLFHPSSRIFIGESDSSDKTLDKLRQWHRPQLFTYGNLTVSIPRRTERIGYCRNELLKKAREIRPDYMLVIDVDIFAVNVTSFLSNFDYNTDDWNVMTANLIQRYYYDIWALRTMSETNMDYDVWHRVWALEFSDRYCTDTLFKNIIEIHKKQYPMERGLLEVRSAFGGAGLYKMDATEGCEYSGAAQTCEHVPFHTCMREKNRARIFINPKFTQ